jgi:hypothetical protein
VLNAPIETEASIRGRENSPAVVGKRLPQVTFKEEQERTLVITVIDKSR